MYSIMKRTLLCISIIFFTSFFLHAQQDKTVFIFGHSLVVHDPPLIPTPSNETTVPHWLHFLAEEANLDIAVNGQYGFLQQHDDLPPISQWGFDSVASAWDSDTEPFSAANFDTVLITAGNFIQYQSSNQPYYNDPNTTPLSATLTIVDWVNNQNPDMVTYIYENWPDMAGFLNNGFPASASEFQAYNDYTEGDFHDWWIEYQDFLVAERPNEIIKMIPVGPIISKLLSQAPYDQIPISELYEDDAPHGRPTIYFLAAMITYAAIFQSPAPDSFIVPNTVHSTVANNYQNINTFIWNELLDFNFSPLAESRVFINSPLSVEDEELLNINMYPNPTQNILYFDGELDGLDIEVYDTLGKKMNIEYSSITNTLDLTDINSGVLFVKFSSDRGSFIRRIVKL